MRLVSSLAYDLFADKRGRSTSNTLVLCVGCVEEFPHNWTRWRHLVGNCAADLDGVQAYYCPVHTEIRLREVIDG